MVSTGRVNISDPELINPVDAHHPGVFNRLDMYDDEGIRYRLEKFTKFLFVRHPFERFLSAYLDKFVKVNLQAIRFYRPQYGRDIITDYRPGASIESLVRAHDVAFPEFAQYVIDSRVAGDWLDDHWRPIEDLCFPCTINFDVIGKYESLVEDVWYVMEKTRLGHQFRFPSSSGMNKSQLLLDKYMSLLSSDQIMQLFQVYKNDFKLFEYQYKGMD